MKLQGHRDERATRRTGPRSQREEGILDARVLTSLDHPVSRLPVWYLRVSVWGISL